MKKTYPASMNPSPKTAAADCDRIFLGTPTGKTGCSRDLELSDGSFLLANAVEKHFLPFFFSPKTAAADWDRIFLGTVTGKTGCSWDLEFSDGSFLLANEVTKHFLPFFFRRTWWESSRLIKKKLLFTATIPLAITFNVSQMSLPLMYLHELTILS